MQNQNHQLSTLSLILASVLLAACASETKLPLVSTASEVESNFVTSWTLKNAQGVEHGNLPPAIIEDAWVDESQDEYIICLVDSFNNHKINKGKFTFRIPKVINKVADKTNSHEMLGYKVLDVVATVYDGCNPIPTHWQAMETFRVKPDTPILNDAKLFNGNTFNELIEKNKSFLVHIQNTSKDLDEEKNWPCGSGVKRCLMVISSQQNEFTDKESLANPEIISIRELIWVSGKKPFWYVATPFAVAFDAAWIGLLLIGIGLGGTI